MYWPNLTDDDDTWLLREKVFPPAAVVPDFDSTDWYPQGIRIGGVPGSLDVNFCYNTMCSHFGLSHSEANKQGKPYGIRRKGNLLNLICTECGLNRRIYNNHAVDAMFLHVLKNHLPHQYCKLDYCHNYRYNLYEYYEEFYEPVTPPPEQPEGFENYKYLVKCTSCDRRFAAGTPWRIHDKRDRQTRSGKVPRRPFPVSTQVFMKLACNGIGPSAMIELTECNPGDYYALLHNLAQVCNEMSGRHLMELQSGRYSHLVNSAANDNTIRLYTDMMEISILTDDRDSRIHRLPCLITVTDFRASFFTLAVTPMFMPMSLPRDQMKAFRTRLRRESLYLESHRPHAHLLSDEVATDSDLRPGSRKYTYPMLGLGGYFVRSSYGALAHFLTLRKMLSRIDRVIHYVDNESPLEMAAVTAFADKIQARQCDVVAVTIDQQKKLKRLRKSMPTSPFRRDSSTDSDVTEAALQGDGAPENPEEEEDVTLLSKRKKQLSETVSSTLPEDMKEAEVRRAAVRKGEEAVRYARAVINHVKKAFELPADIFAEKRSEFYDDVLAALPSEVTGLVGILAGRTDEVAALAKEVAALASDADKLPDEARVLTAVARNLAKITARLTGKKLDRPKRQRPNDMAYVYRLAVNKSVKEAGLDLWVQDKYAPAFEPNRRFLWLTRRAVPTQNPSEQELRQQFDKEVELYLHGKHQPADTYMSSLRQLASTAERARLIASVRHGAGYVSSPRLPTSIISEIALHRFRWNFMRRRREKKMERHNTRARKLGLDVPGALTVNDAATVRRKVFEWAQKITYNLRGMHINQLRAEVNGGMRRVDGMHDD